MAFIEFKNVSYEIEDKIILKNINLTVDKGEFVGILGANGSGKSTLAKLINGLVLPTEGKVLINNLDTADEKNTEKIRQTVGIVFQNPDNQIIASTVEDDIAFGPENLNLNEYEIEERINNAINLTGLEDKRTASPYMLSGGQKQKVAIAGALAMNTDAIIFDEATSMLDPKSKNEVINKIVQLNKKNNMTVIYITHFSEEILNADKIIILNNGTVEKTGAPEEIFSDRDLKKINLELPFIYNLSQELREMGISLSDNFFNEKNLITELKFISKNSKI